MISQPAARCPNAPPASRTQKSTEQQLQRCSVSFVCLPVSQPTILAPLADRSPPRVAMQPAQAAAAAAASLSPQLGLSPNFFLPLSLRWHPSMQMGELMSSPAASSVSAEGGGGALAAGVQPQQPPVSLPLGSLPLGATHVSQRPSALLSWCVYRTSQRRRSPKQSHGPETILQHHLYVLACRVRLR